MSTFEFFLKCLRLAICKTGSVPFMLKLELFLLSAEFWLTMSCNTRDAARRGPSLVPRGVPRCNGLFSLVDKCRSGFFSTLVRVR
jgi:hypothetical protein